ncbi:MAG: chorismate mutase [Clostridia bacterium]|nr:chorismate mutase [Clostridia bacterium]
MKEDALQQAREIINKIDADMADLFVQRMKAVEQVADYKIEHGMPVYDEVREQQVISAASQRVEDDVLRGYYTDFMQDMMTISRRYQQRLMTGLKVAYSGTLGAYAHVAATKLFPEAEKVAFGNMKEAYDAVVGGICDIAVLPIENSSAGEVGQTTDLLFSGPLYINGITNLAISHDLLGAPGSKLEDITEVISHPQALSQCQEFIRKGGYKETPYENTALAAEYVAKLNDPHIAAVANEDTSELYGLSVLARGINESVSNTTRFAVVSRSENRNLSKQHGAHFVLMFTVRNEAGSLARALNIMGAHGFNMRTLRSRPMKELLWQYYFYVEAEGDIHGYEGRCMMEELAVCCDRLKIVGSFVAQG